MKHYLAIVGLVITTVIWGGGFVASDLALESLTPFQILTIRFGVAAVVMALPAARRIPAISRREWRCGFLLGAFLFGGFALQIVGLQYTTVSNNAFLTATNVVIVPFIALVCYRRRIERRCLAGAVMALTGVGILSLQQGFSIGIGDVLTLLCAICFALQIFFTGEYVEKIPSSVLNFVQMLTAFGLSLLGLVFTGGFVMQPSRTSLLAVIYLGVMSTAVCYFLQTISQKYVRETQSAIILSMESLFGTLFSVLLLHESVTVRMVTGAALILGAVLLSQIPAGKKRSRLSDLRGSA